MIHTLVSIIVPTFNDWSRLALCVKALAEQSYPKESIEVLIVNNNPENLAPENFMLPERFRIITEAKPGSYAARNAALKLAQGAIIGFTDSDCIPHADWIQNAVSYLDAHKECSRVAGYISIFPDGPKPNTTDLYNTVFEFPQVSYTKYSGTSVTANLFTYKSVFEEVGFFNDKLFSLVI